MLVRVKRLCFFLHAPLYQSLQCFQKEGHERDGTVGTAVTVVIFARFGKEDDVSIPPESGGISEF
jgi:hypothetical protein